MVVYLDVLFAVNALMDGATLLAAARLGGVQVRKMRLIFSAALGGGYAVLGAVWPVLTLAPLRLLAGLGLCMIAFGRERHLARLCILYGVVAASFAGLAAALSAASGRRLLLSCGYYFAVPIQVLVLAAAVGYAASGILLRGDAKHGALHRETETLTIRFGNRQTAVRVLHDTGNDLLEPVSGKPVVVLERKAAECLLDTAVRQCVRAVGGSAGKSGCTLRSAAVSRGRHGWRSAAVFPAGQRAESGRHGTRLCVCGQCGLHRTGRVRGTYRGVKGRAK